MGQELNLCLLTEGVNERMGTKKKGTESPIKVWKIYMTIIKIANCYGT